MSHYSSPRYAEYNPMKNHKLRILCLKSPLRIQVTFFPYRAFQFTASHVYTGLSNRVSESCSDLASPLGVAGATQD